MSVFFNHATPSDIGLSGAMSAYSHEVLAAIFNVDPAFFKPIPKIPKDLMIVKGG